MPLGRMDEMDIIDCTERPTIQKGQRLFIILEEAINLYPKVYKVTSGNHVAYYVIKDDAERGV